MRQEFTRKGLASPDILGLLDQERQRADVDSQLAEVIKEGPPVILGFFFRGVGGTSGGVKPERLMGASFIQASSYNLVRCIDTQPSQVPLIGAAGVELNLPMITEAAAGGGYFNMVPDVDGTVRWFPMTIIYGSDFFAPMSLVATDHYLGRPPLAITVSQLGVEEIRQGQKKIPVDRHGRALINYLGPAGMIPTYSAASLLDGNLPPRVLKDKIVLVGATAVGIYDLRVTPFSGICPGVEIQATVIDNLLKGNFIRTPRLVLLVMLCILLGLGILLGVLLPRLSAAWSFLVTLIIIAAYTVFNYLLFSRLALQLELFYPLMTIVMVYVGISMHRFLAEERERVRIRKAFESYVAPTVVQEMLKHPEQLRLGGERREITVLFSDIRGFTTMSENMESREISGDPAARLFESHEQHHHQPWRHHRQVYGGRHHGRVRRPPDSGGPCPTGLPGRPGDDHRPEKSERVLAVSGPPGAANRRGGQFRAGDGGQHGLRPAVRLHRGRR